MASSPKEPVELAACLSSDETSPSAEVDQCKVDLLAAMLRLVETYATMYSNQDAFIELFRPIQAILESSRVAKLSPAIKVSLPHQVYRLIEAKQSEQAQHHPLHPHAPTRLCFDRPATPRAPVAQTPRDPEPYAQVRIRLYAWKAL
jgi:hypothetical protein